MAAEYGSKYESRTSDAAIRRQTVTKNHPYIASSYSDDLIILVSSVFLLLQHLSYDVVALSGNSKSS